MGLIYYLVTVVISVILFLVLRELMCWFFKINERIQLMEEIKSIMRTSDEQEGEDAQDNEKQRLTSCPECGEKIEGTDDDFCGACGNSLKSE